MRKPMPRWRRITATCGVPAELFAERGRTHTLEYGYTQEQGEKLPEHFGHFVYDTAAKTLSFPVVRNI